MLQHVGKHGAHGLLQALALELEYRCLAKDARHLRN
jgi:hypothetical protein